MTTANKSEKDRVIVFDTTLRDGEQCPGATMTYEEKLEVAEMLDDMGVDVIEAGFPITSEGDFQAVSEIARRSKNSVIAGLSRAHPKDIDRCAEAVKFARRGRVHTVIATSPLHMRVKLNMTPEQVMELSIGNVTRARNQIDDVEWSAEDATRSEMDYLCRIVEAVIKAGATTVNIPDTVGYTTPEEYGHFMRTLIERVPNSDKAVFSVHCHNDLGMAVANSLAGIAGGARQIECTVNGIGERAGNAALEEVVMAINVRNDVTIAQIQLSLGEIALGRFEVRLGLLDRGGPRHQLRQDLVDVALRVLPGEFLHHLFWGQIVGVDNAQLR